MDRKLDMAIAEALGYEVLFPDSEFPGVKRGRLRHPYGGYYDDLEYLSKYFTNPSSMVELITEMQKRGWEVEITSRTAGGYLARFYMLDTTSNVNIWCHAEKIPNAVALAAYKALTGKVWEY